MASKVDILVEKIEKLREDMHSLAGRKGITSPEVLTISQQIDVELNHYYRLTREKAYCSKQ
ncbi:aspartyl-phosphate phosphatase Spo0E family protein [Ammoniphilus sp. YIM 78166]|uniref:aspartyl-phosphate phosphatase Spo0E family protein n=1 Tax=Ammoniphilus sp. YIM 78166 TaxID=1644106 RepID=UPI001F10B6F8|nr:aspartyl-phosphate phosphatase Spo0E family protein [Ammoniphilus sp. YIM 78166]